MEKNNKLAVFQDREIRRIFQDDMWYFVIEDIVRALTDSNDPKQYIQKMKQRDEELKKGWVQIVHTLPIPTEGGSQNMNCASTEGVFRIIQSIPSIKAEPFKLWLAKVGAERIEEIQDPELAQKRMKELYRAKGYSDEWIEKRVRGIAVRQELTEEWKNRGIQNREYAILTDDITKATFGMTVNEYKQFKDLEKHNLRDHMHDLELIFTMLGESVSTEITRKDDAQGFPKVQNAAQKGGKVAGNARKETEKELGCSIVTNDNFLAHPEKKKRLENKVRK